MPAKAGIQVMQGWLPACVGMTQVDYACAADATA